MLSSELACKLLGSNAIPYNLIQFHKESASRCPLFTSEDYGYVPISRFSINYNSSEALMQFYETIGSEDIFRKMLVLDAITFNVDRHAGNYGVLVENDTQTPMKMAPIFDLNLALLPYIEKEDMKNIGNKLEEYGPRIGEDFTRIGQQALTPEIRSKLIGLKGFQFSFKGDEHFESKRVKFLEEIVNRQIEAVLDKNILYTRDVFVPELRTEYENTFENSDYELVPAEIETTAEKLFALLKKSDLFSCYDLERVGEHFEMILFSQKDLENTIRINLEDMSYQMISEGGELSIYEIKKILEKYIAH